jgi:hypothetical protein
MSSAISPRAAFPGGRLWGLPLSRLCRFGNTGRAPNVGQLTFERLIPKWVPDSVPDYVHFAAFWCILVLEAKTLSQGASARCAFVHFGAIVSAGF